MCASIKRETFFGGAGAGPRKAVQQGEGLCTFGQISAGQFTEDHGMNGDVPKFERGGKVRQTAPEMLNPDGGVSEDHLPRLASGRRRAGRVSAGIVAPSAASRRAASRSMSASSPMRTRAVFSVSPVYSPAWMRSASSMFSVVLMHTLMPRSDAAVNSRNEGRTSVLAPISWLPQAIPKGGCDA